MTKKIVLTVLAVICSVYTVIDNWACLGVPSSSKFWLVVMTVTLFLAPILIVLSAYLLSQGKDVKHVVKSGLVSLAVALVSFLILCFAPFDVSDEVITGCLTPQKIYDGLMMSFMLMPAIYAVTFFTIAIIKKLKAK